MPLPLGGSWEVGLDFLGRWGRGTSRKGVMSPQRPGAALPWGQRPDSGLAPTQAARRPDPQPSPLKSVNLTIHRAPPPTQRAGSFWGLRWRSQRQGWRAGGALQWHLGPQVSQGQSLRPRPHWVRDPEDPHLEVLGIWAHTSVCMGTGMYSHTVTGKAQLPTGGLRGPETLHSDQLPRSAWFLHTHTHTTPPRPWGT